ncbi:MAG: hypothetical protein ABI960_10385 [Candidatus Eisenbacteria bacterium]
METRPTRSLRIALVDLDWRRLDVFRAALAASLRDAGQDPAAGAEADVRLVIAEGPEAPAFHWARLAGVARSGEVARLGEVVVDAIVVSAASPRAPVAARLAAALGAIVVALPAPALDRVSQRAGKSS